MFENTIKGLEKRGYKVEFFETSKEALEYLKRTIIGTTVGFGGSRTLETLDLKGVLSEKNTVYMPDSPDAGEGFRSTAKKAMNTEYFFLSANAMSEDGIIVNIDEFGNRISGSLYGHEKVVYVVGTNKISGNLEETINRARNVAAPQNCIRLGKRTPCAVTGGEKCFDCKSPDRLCNNMLINFHSATSSEAYVILINEELGF